MTDQKIREDAVSRRTVLYGLGALAGDGLLTGCGSSGSNSSSTPPISPYASQPVPSGPLTQARVTVSGSSGFSVGSAFTGLSYEKDHFASYPVLAASPSRELV